MSERPTRRRSSAPVTTDERTELTEPRKPGRMAWEPEEPVFDFDADMEIDLNFLHIECQNHAALFMKYAKESSRSAKAASYAEEKVKTKRSQLIKEANEDPDGTLGVGIKPTAPNVDSYFRNDDDYKRIKQDFIDATYYADLMKNCVFAMQARKSMLEMEVKLHGQQYFAVPEIENLSDAAKQFTRLKELSVEQRIKNRMNKKEA